jgi:glycosyltransferase involved in cell wall biosynthesis
MSNIIHDELKSVYAGIEPLKELSYLSAHRNITDLDRIFNENDIGKLILIGRTNFQTSVKVINKGLLSRDKMYNEMAKCSIGLLPMKKIWSHKYINPNKPFEYAHAGLYVICTSSFSDVAQILNNNCTTIEDYDDLVTQLLYFRDNKEELFKKRIKIYDFAKENLIWEKYEGNIIDAYKSI